MCDPAKIVFTFKCSYLQFGNPTNKTENGTANRRPTTNSKPPGPIIMMTQSETLSSSSQIIFIILCCADAQQRKLNRVIMLYYTLLCRCTATQAEPCYYAEPKPFSWGKPACFDFSSSNFNVHCHILSTAGDSPILWVLRKCLHGLQKSLDSRALVVICFEYLLKELASFCWARQEIGKDGVL